MNRIALLLFPLVLALLVLALPLGIGLEAAFDLVGFHLFALVLATAGLLVASRHPSNRVGWLFLGIAVLQGFMELCQACASSWRSAYSSVGPTTTPSRSAPRRRRASRVRTRQPSRRASATYSAS